MESIASEHGHEIIRTFLNRIVEPLPVVRPETSFEEIRARAEFSNTSSKRTSGPRRRGSVLGDNFWLARDPTTIRGKHESAVCSSSK